MVEDGEIKCSTHAYNLKVYCTPKTTLLRDTQLKHKLLVGDLYVAFELTGKLQAWYSPIKKDAFGIIPDARMLYDGRIIFWEVDRGTEDYRTSDGIKGKLDKYVALSKAYPDERFHVCFTTIDNKQTALTRCESLLSLFTEYRRGDQFISTLHKWAVDKPDDAAFLSPINLMGIAFSELE